MGGKKLSYRVRPFERRDFKQLVALDDVVLERDGTGGFFAWGAEGLAHAFVAEKAGRVVGYAAVSTPSSHGCGSLFYAVHPDHRNAGVGRLLVNAAVRAALAAGMPSVEALTSRPAGAVKRFVGREFGASCKETPSGNRIRFHLRGSLE